MNERGPVADVTADVAPTTPPLPRCPMTRPSAERLGQARHHAAIFGVSLAVLAASVVLRAEESHVTFAGWQLPPLCSFRSWTGIDCPGCGLTRCFIHLGHARVADAWQANPAGLAVFVLVAVQLPYRGLRLLRLYRGERSASANWLWLLPFVIGLLLVQWVAKLVGWGLT